MEKIKSYIGKAVRSRWVFRFIGIAIFILILLRIDLKEALRTLASVDLRFVFLSLMIQAAAIVVATVRWQFILVRLKIRQPFIRTFLQQLVGTSAALVTPGQLGEFIKVLYQRNEGFPVPESFLSVVIDRVYDLLMLFLFGFISLAILFGLSPNTTLILSVIISIGFVLGFLFLRNKEKSADVIANTLSRMSPKAYKESIRRDARRLTREIGDFDIGFLIVIGLLTIVNYVLLIFRIYAIVLSLHIVVPFWYFVMTVPLLRLVGLIPISILGIGTRDLASIYLYGQVGVPDTSALLISTLGLFTIQVQAIIGLVVWWQYPIKFSEEKSISGQEASAND
jgi:uncharacterized protein (TIRG00374 family)